MECNALRLNWIEKLNRIELDWIVHENVFAVGKKKRVGR